MAGTAWQRVLVGSWARRGPLAWLLAPLALAYAAGVRVRWALYRRRLLRVDRVAVPVIVVGNVVAGGGGKTPLVIAIVRHLQHQGLQVGVVSRGYGRHGTDCRQVSDSSTARDAGDEPLLIRQSTGAPVFVAARRIDAARALLQQYPGTHVLICDDGLQHLQLHRDIEICVFGPGGIGNGWVLPAGPLREPWPRAVDLTVAEGSTPTASAWQVQRRFAGQAVRADGSKSDLQSLRTSPVWAVAAIAHPDAFFAMLRHAGIPLAGTTALPDHDDFTATGWLPPASQTLVCTEKDAVKLWAHRPDAWALPLVLDLPDGFWTQLDLLLAARGVPKLSSAHGHTTA